MKRILSLMLANLILISLFSAVPVTAEREYLFTDSISNLSVTDEKENFGKASIYASSNSSGSYDPANLNDDKTRGFFVLEENGEKFIRVIGSGYINQDSGTSGIMYTNSADTVGVFEAKVRLSNSSGFKMNLNKYIMSVSIPDSMLNQWVTLRLYMENDGTFKLKADDSEILSGTSGTLAALFSDTAATHRINFSNAYSSGETGRIMDIASYCAYEIKKDDAVKISISGNSEAEIPQNDEIFKYNYSAASINYNGEFLDKDITWSFDDSYSGVSISDGVLAVDSDARNGKIGIVCECDDFFEVYYVTLTGGNETEIASNFTVLPGYTKENIVFNVIDEKDGIKSTDFKCEDNSKRLLYGYDFKAGKVFLVQIKMRVVSGTGNVTCSVVRPEGLPAREFLSNRMSVGEEYKTYSFYYKCGDADLPDNTPVPGYINFYVAEKNVTLRIRSVSIREITSGYYPTYKLPYSVGDEITENKDIITRLTFKGYMEERENGFCPDEEITGNEFIKSLVLVGGFSSTTYNNCFSDVTSSALNSGYIQKAYDLGVISGDTFSKYEKVDFALLKALCEKLYFAASGESMTYEEMGQADLSGKDIITRSDAAVVLYNLLEEVREAKLKDAFIAWAENAITVYENNGMTEEAEKFTAELEEWKQNAVVERNTDSNVMIDIKDFYENPVSKRIINEIIKCGIGAKTYTYIKVGDAARSSFTTFTAPTSVAGQMQTLLWGILNEDSPYAGNPYALTYVLSNLEILSYMVNEGDSQYYIEKKDMNYNMFFFQNYMYSYLLLKEIYPCFILPSMEERLDGIIDDAIKYQENYNKENGEGYYANVDVMLANMYAYAGRILENEEYLKRADEILENVADTVYEDGAIPYIGSENEVASYHNNIIKDVGKNYLVTKSEAAKALLQKTVNYYPVTLENNLYAELSTAVVFKQSWGQANLVPGVTVASYFEDGGKNKAIEERIFDESPYLVEASLEGALVAGAFYDNEKPADGTVFSDGITEDKNIGGARGKYGDFSYTMDFRNRRLREGYPISFPGNGIHIKGTYPGKSSYVGVTFTEPNRSDSLLGAVSKVYQSVKHSETGKEYADRTNVSNYSDEWFELGDSYAAGGTTYSLGTYGASAMTYNNLNGFLGHELWYGEKDRLIGVMIAEAVDDAALFGQSARIQFVEGKSNTYDLKENIELVKNVDGTYSFGNIGIKVHDTNYEGVNIDLNSKIVNTAINSSSVTTELVFGEEMDTSYEVKSGEKKYIVLELYNNSATAPLSNVTFKDNNRVFELNIDGKNVLYNLSEQNISSDGVNYSHGDGGVIYSYTIRENVTPKTLFEKDFEEESFTVGDKGYYTGDSNDNSADNVLFYDSGSDTTLNPEPHFEICKEDGNKYLKFKVNGMDEDEEGTVKSYFLQFNNMNSSIPFKGFLYENSEASPEKFSLEFDIKCPVESYDTSLKLELFQNTEDNKRGAATSITFACGNEKYGEAWVHHKLIFDKRARKIYLYRDNALDGEYDMSPASDLFRYGINLMRIYYIGVNSDGSFAKDSVTREILLDNFELRIPEITYKNAELSGSIVNAEILNNTFETRTVKLICAGYVGEKLDFLKSSDSFLINPGETENICYEFNNENEAKTVKVFLWDDYSGMRPLENEIN